MKVENIVYVNLEIRKPFYDLSSIWDQKIIKNYREKKQKLWSEIGIKIEEYSEMI